MLLHPTKKAVAIARDRVPCGVEGIVAPIVAVSVGWARAAWRRDDRTDCPVWQNGRVWAWRPQIVDDFLHRHNRLLRREHNFLLPTGDALAQHVAGAVGALGMDDAKVRAQRRHGRQPVAGEWARHKANIWVIVHQ